MSNTLRKWMFIITLFSLITIAAAVLISQLISSNNDTTLDRQYSSTLAIEIMPSLKIQIEWLHLSVVILYTAGLVYTSKSYIHWYFVPLAVFIGIQWVYNTCSLLDREGYILDQLQLSWQAAYKDNLFILENIQNQWHCQGFTTIFDRPAYTLTENEDAIDACYPILSKTFGSTIFIWGIGLWVVKVIQIIGLLACYALYLHAQGDFNPEDQEQGAIQLFGQDADIKAWAEDDHDAATIVVAPDAVNEKYPL